MAVHIVDRRKCMLCSQTAAGEAAECTGVSERPRQGSLQIVIPPFECITQSLSYLLVVNSCETSHRKSVANQVINNSNRAPCILHNI